MDIKECSIEELKAELQLRYAEERRIRNANRDNKAKYAYATGIVTWVSEHPFSRRDWIVKISDEDIEKYNLGAYYSKQRNMRLIYHCFNKDTAPKVGDLVRIRSRITKACLKGFGLFNTPYICEVIKRKEEL